MVESNYVLVWVVALLADWEFSQFSPLIMGLVAVRIGLRHATGSLNEVQRTDVRAHLQWLGEQDTPEEVRNPGLDAYNLDPAPQDPAAEPVRDVSTPPPFEGEESLSKKGGKHGSERGKGAGAASTGGGASHSGSDGGRRQRLRREAVWRGGWQRFIPPISSCPVRTHLPEALCVLASESVLKEHALDSLHLEWESVLRAQAVLYPQVKSDAVADGEDALAQSRTGSEDRTGDKGGT